MSSKFYRYNVWKKLIFFYVFILVFICSGCFFTEAEINELLNIEAKPILHRQEALARVLCTYQTALETEDIRLFTSCFTTNFHSSKHNSLDLLKAETQKFFIDYKNIKIEIDGTKTTINVEEEAGEIREIGKTKAVVTFLYKIKAVAVASEGIYSRGEKKCFYLRKEDAEWKIESEKILPAQNSNK